MDSAIDPGRETSQEEGLELIAVTGLAGRFPGARNIDEFWQNLYHGECTIKPYTDEMLAEAGHNLVELRANPDYVTAGGFLSDVDLFDAALFGYNPQEATLLDPQHRLLLEVSWQALEVAGIDPERFDGSIGVYTGKAKNSYLTRYLLPNRAQTAGSEDLLMVLGNESDYLSTAISYRLGLSGPSVNVHTACSTSLVAIHQARQSLLNYECDAALAGGVCIRLPEGEGYEFNEGNILSSDGITRTFDQGAEGTNFANGAGMVVLKRLNDALLVGDTVYAVLRGSAVNNDGPNRQGYMAPGVNGQAEVISLAIAEADVNPADISYVEAHGTATPLGDPIEVAGLTQAFRAQAEANQFCALGSVKSNIGHLDAAAGVSGFIKTVLSLQHRTLPASLHCTEVNPAFEIENTPFYINRERQPWKPGPDGTRIAGISSFGAGGTNAHAVLQEAPELKNSGAGRHVQLLPLSAQCEAAVREMAANLAAYLTEHPDSDLADIAWTLQSGRRQLGYRASVSCTDSVTAAVSLQKSDKLKVYKDIAQTDKLVFMFPGQGSQYLNMAHAIYTQEPVFKEAFDQCCQIYQTLDAAAREEISLASIIFTGEALPEGETAQLGQTRYTQPALFVVEYALAQLWLSWGLRPQAMIGHSVGEYVAATLAGVFSLDTALAIIKKRAELIQSLDAGSMLAVSAPAEQVRALLTEQLSVSVVNTPHNCVVGGPHAVVAKYAELLSEHEIESRVLRTSHAFHSAMMEPVLADFEAWVSQYTLNKPDIPFISSFTGDWITPEQACSAHYWARHIREAVLFADGLQSVERRFAEAVYLEVGPGNVLTSLTRHCIKPKAVVSSLGHATEVASEALNLVEAMGQLWCNGVAIDWQAYSGDQSRRRVRLPAYPFQRESYWVDAKPVLSIADKLAANVPHAVSLGSELAQEQFAVASAVAPEVTLAGEGGSIEGQAATREDLLIGEIQSILSSISGLDAQELDTDTSFIKLGFDSLFLTQASNALRKKFKVSITFRDLLEEKPTVGDLARFLDETLDPEQFKPLAANVGVAQPVVAASLGGAGVAGDAMQRLIDEQLRLLSLQMNNLLQARGAHSGSQPIITQPHAPTVATAAPSSLSQPMAAAEKHGPWKQINKQQSTEVSALNQQALDDLVERYTRKTAASKAMAQQHRAHFADPRGISGFNRLWKELVYPLVTERSSGARMWDIDGNEYLEVQSGFGSVFFGHSMPFIREALETQLQSGMQIGPQSHLAGQVAQDICELTGMDRATFCNTGSEAVLAAMRVSRTVTGNNKVVMFAQDYHGIFDEVVSRRAGNMDSLTTVPAAPGIPAESLENIVILDYGDPHCFAILDSIVDDLAAVMIEPVQSRRPDFQPLEFVRQLREWTRNNNVVYIFDEVITGFRLHQRGAQGWYDVEADLCTYGKVIGGGMPAGVLAGKAQYMDALDGGAWEYGDSSIPEVGVTYFAGTFVRHPLMIAAAAAAVGYLKAHGAELYDELNAKSSQFAENLNARFEEQSLALHLQHCGSMMYLEFLCDSQFNPLLFYYLRLNGVYILEAGTFFITLAHSAEDLAVLADKIIQAASWMQENEFHPVLDKSSATMTAVGKLGANGSGQAAGQVTDQLTGLSSAQQEIWLAVQMGDDASCAYNLSNTLTLSGQLDLPKLKAAMLTLVNLHDALRMTISANGDMRVQAGVAEIALETYQCDDMSGAEQNIALSTVAARDASTPFDLENGPLIRFHLFIMADDRHVVFITAHHIASDGWSCGILMRQLSELYNGRTLDPQQDVLQFSQYRQWLLEPEQQRRHEEDKTYWLNIHKKPAPDLELPLDKLRPPIKTFNAGTAVVAANPGTVRAVNTAARSLGVTQYHFLLAAFQALLFRLSRQTDFNIAIPVAGQLQADNPNVVGHCVNLMCLRSELDSASSFADTVLSTRKLVFDAFEHPFFNYGELVESLDLPNEPSRNALVSVVFNVDVVDAKISFDELELLVGSNSRQYEVFELFLDIGIDGEQLTLNCTYNSDLFEQATVARWMALYLQLLESVTLDQQTPLASLSLLGDQELRKITVEWNNTEQAYPDKMSLPELCSQRFSQCLAMIAVESDQDGFIGVTPGKAGLSYAELEQYSNQLAHYLIANGLTPGARVGVCVQRGVELPLILLGVLKCGASYIPLDPDYPLERLQYMVEDAKPEILLTDAASQHSLSGMQTASRIVNLTSAAVQIRAQAGSLPECEVSANDIAYIIYTSGSTGKPKGVCIRHRSVVNFLLSMQRQPGFDHDDRLLAVTTLSFDIAVLELFLPLISGATVVIASRQQASDGAELLSLLNNRSISCMQATPATWRMLVEAGLAHSGSLKALCGGEALSAELASDLVVRTQSLWNLYGPTEATVWVSAAHIDRGNPTVVIGKPIHNTRFYVLDEQLSPVPVGVPGELFIAGECLAAGYLNRPELDRERFIANPFAVDNDAKMYRTGDLVRYREDGTLQYISRLDSQIKLRGFRIELGEIESVLEQHPEVRQCVARIVEFAPGDTRLQACYIAAGSGAGTDQMRQFLKSKLPDYMLPQYLDVLDSFPLTPAGKVDRNQLPLPDLELKPSEYRAPATDTERKLAAIWSELLHIEDTGSEDNFFNIGGHSLLAVRLAASIAETFNIKLNLRDILSNPTIAAQALLMDALAPATVADSDDDEREDLVI